MNRFTRRDLALVAAGAAGLTGSLQPEAHAQIAEPQSMNELEAASLASKRAAAARLARFDLPMATEPAFHFRA
jgi:hypothetical protein